MATNYVQEGDVLMVAAGGTPIASGAVILFGKRIGIAIANIGANESGAMAVEGVFSIAKLSTDVVAQGALLYWDATNLRLTTTASGNTLAGYAAAAAGNGATVVNININK